MNRRDYPHWFDLMDKVNAIIGLKFATAKQFAGVVGIAYTNVYNYLNYQKQAQSNTGLKIQSWVKVMEHRIARAKKVKEYSEAVFKQQRK